MNKPKESAATAPIFIIGTERSGTNPLRLMLDAHPDIAVPHPPHIMKNFFALEPFYGDLREERRFRRLVRDVLKMIALHPYPWELELKEEEVFKACRDRNLISVFFAAYDLYLAHRGKKRWACKSTFMIRHVALVRRYFPRAKFIYMVRDGRDVAASARETIFNHYSVYYSARLWKEEQRTGISWLNDLNEDEITLLKYEDLVKAPEASLRSLCVFLEVPFAAEMPEFFKTQEAGKSGSLSDAWRNTAKPVSGDSVGRFKKKLSESDIRLFEAIAGGELKYFSYPAVSPVSESEPALRRAAGFRLGYLLEELFLMLKVQWRYMFLDKSSFLRYKKFWFLRLLRVIRPWA